jgi:hypothetical protein
MEASSLATIVRTLNESAVRYLIAGGLAVVAHGYVRFTADVDLIIDLESGNITRALHALEQLEYRPRAPVALAAFADPDARSTWIAEKRLTVFSLYSPKHPATEVDLFVQLPLDFDTAYRAAQRMEVAPGVSATFIGLDDLVRLKEQAGRPQDHIDIQKLRELSERASDE